MARIVDPQRVYHYVYLCQDSSVLTPVLKKYFWNHLLNIVPKYTSANLMSFVANFGSWIGFAVLIGALGPMSELAAESTLYYLFPVLGIWFYHTLDNIDGSQARRTKSSSPLGEFMDHWFDTFNSFMLPIGLIYAAGIDGISLVLMAATSVWAFWWVMWEQRKTGTIILGKASQVEGVMLVIVLHLLSVIVGPQYLDTQIGPYSLLYYLAYFTMANYIIIGFAPVFNLKEDRLEVLGVLASMALVGIWYAITQYKGMTTLSTSIMFPVIIGLIGCKHIGDNQRARLMGTQFKVLDISFLVAGGIAIGGAFFDWSAFSLTPTEGQYATGSAFLTWVLLKLFYQYFHTTGYITEKLGINVFSLTADQKKALEQPEAATSA